MHFTEKDKDRFWSSMDRSGDCWIWTKRRHKFGYGEFKLGRTKVRAHQVAHYLSTGERPEVVRHTCDNPPCCNPAHLLSGTYLDNTRDCIERGRRVQVSGEAHGKSKLTAKQVNAVRMSTLSARTLATRYGVSTKTVYNVRNGRAYASVPVL